MAKATFEIDKDKLVVTIVKVFNASPQRLWQALTEADQIPKWWDDTVVDKQDLKVGGAWRYVSTGPDGSQHAFKGEFKEIDEPKKLVRTFEYEPVPGHVMIETALLEPHDGGQTKLTTISKYDNLGDLEGMVGMGMEDGALAGLERLAKLVEAS